MEFEFPGKLGKQMFALTVTSRHSNTKEGFIKGLTQFLKDTKYPCRIKGVLEYHPRKPNQLHLHGITTFGNPPKNNKTNEYYFHQTKIISNDAKAWNAYMYKEINKIRVLFDD